MNEFELIDFIIERLSDTASASQVRVGPGDDGAVVSMPPGQEMVVTTDTLLPGRHVPLGTPPAVIGYRAIAVNLSDLAAMGAQPHSLVVALTMDSADPDWVGEFADGIACCSREFDVPIVGGNLSRGPLNVTVSAHGTVPEHKALQRRGAQDGDDVWMSGQVGATTWARSCGWDIPDGSLTELLFRRKKDALAHYLVPEPRVQLGIALRDVATAAIDISDGLVADLGHLVDNSGCGAEIELGSVKVWPDADPIASIANDDSYELLWTSPSAERSTILTIAQQCDVTVSRIGRFTSASTGVTVWDSGQRIDVNAGYSHF